MDLSRKMVEMLEAFRLNESKLESKKDILNGSYVMTCNKCFSVKEGNSNLFL